MKPIFLSSLRYWSAWLIFLWLAGCADTTTEENTHVVSPAETIDADLETQQIVDAFEKALGADFNSEQTNARRGLYLPLTTYQIVVKISSITGEFSRLLTAVETAGLEETLASDTLTIFTPTNAAFARMGLDETALRQLDPETLRNILTYHATPGKRYTPDLLEEERILMLNGGFTEVTRKKYRLFVNDVQLLAPFLVNITTRNGVLHIIPEVLDPADSPILAPSVTGLAYAATDKSAGVAADALAQIIESNPNIGLVAHIDHAANAESVGQELRPTEVLVFGNPNLGTPLMQRNQTIGIDLPQKILFYENAQGQTYAAYNTPEYLASRHGLSADSATFPMIGNALKTLTENATGGEVMLPEEGKVPLQAGLVIKKSSLSVEDTYRKLVGIVESAGPLRIIAEVDHAANAERVGLSLRPTKLLIFGNPNLGTPLMQSAQTVGIDLPQKMLVWEAADGQVYLAYNDPFYLAQRHGISSDQAELATIAQALEGIASRVTE